jgi:hypothetical protein
VAQGDDARPVRRALIDAQHPHRDAGMADPITALFIIHRVARGEMLTVR